MNNEKFKELHIKFEKKETDLHKLQKEKGFSRYILIRSLAKDHLKELIKKFTGEILTKGKADIFYEKLYNSNASIDDIIKYINKKYPEVKNERKNRKYFFHKSLKDLKMLNVVFVMTI